MKKYLVLDESGGFKNKNERYFIIAGYVTDDLTKIVSIHKRAEEQIKFFRLIPKKTKIELKASKLKPKEKALFVNELFSISNVHGVAIIIDKNHNELSLTENGTYNYLVKLLLECLIRLSIKQFDSVSELHLKLDERGVGVKNLDQLEKYLLKNLNIPEITVKYLDSAVHREIQMADYVANIIYAQYNYKKTSTTHKYIWKYNQIYISKFPYTNFGK